MTPGCLQRRAASIPARVREHPAGRTLTPENKRMPLRFGREPEPDETRDVIVQHIHVLDAQSLEEQPAPWSIFVHHEKRRGCNTRREAEEYARRLACTLGVRAWLLDETGYFLRPIR